MRGPAAAAAALLLWAGCGSEGRFVVAGAVTAPPRFHAAIDRPNAVLFVVATNAAGVPVAVKRVINPRLPLAYELRREDLVLPGPAWRGALSVRVYITPHGKLGEWTRGDLRGAHPGTVRTGERHANVVVDEQL